MNFEGGMRADINKTVRGKIKAYVNHAQNKQSQEGYSIGSNIGVEQVGVHGSFKTGEKILSQDSTGKDLTEVNISTDSNVERRDQYYKDEDTRFGLGGGLNVGVNNFGMNVSVKVGDNKVESGFSIEKNAAENSKNSFHLGCEIEGVKLGFESDIFKAPEGESALSRGAQWVDKGLYGIQQTCNVVESGNNIIKHFGAEGLDLNEKMENTHHYLNIGREGMTTVTKIGNTEWGKNLSNKVVASLSSNTCAYDGLEHLLGKSFQELAKDARKGVSMNGLTLPELESLIKTQQQKGAISNYNIQDVQGEENLTAQLNELGVSKASFILYDSEGYRDHMVLLQKNEAGSWGAYDVKGGTHVPIDFHSLEQSKGSLVAVNTALKRSHSEYDRNRQVYVGAQKRPSPQELQEALDNRAKRPRSSSSDSAETTITVTDQELQEALDNPDDRKAALNILNLDWRGPLPQLIEGKYTNRKQEGNHTSPFNGVTGFRSARQYTESLEDKSYLSPIIGHVQGWQNHGPSADTRANNLCVIGGAANVKMNCADKLYGPGDVDGNTFLANKDNLLAHFTCQHLVGSDLREPENHHLDRLVTPSIIIDAKTAEARTRDTKFGREIERAFDPERIKEMKELQQNSSDKVPTREETLKKIKNRIAYDVARGIPIEDRVFKFSDQSRSKRYPSEGKDAVRYSEESQSNGPYHHLPLEELKQLALEANSPASHALIQDAINSKLREESKKKK